MRYCAIGQAIASLRRLVDTEKYLLKKGGNEEMLTEVNQDQLNVRSAARSSLGPLARRAIRRTKHAGTLAPTRMPATQNLDVLSYTKEVP